MNPHLKSSPAEIEDTIVSLHNAKVFSIMAVMLSLQTTGKVNLAWLVIWPQSQTLAVVSAWSLVRKRLAEAQNSKTVGERFSVAVAAGVSCVTKTQSQGKTCHTGEDVGFLLLPTAAHHHSIVSPVR